MALTAGARLGPYEILSALGAGGMGEVYRARDTRLDRTVAIKVLRDALSVDPRFRERFDREARTISQLDHPHICSLYDVGEQDGTSFLVMPYLEGETLEARLKKGALSLDRALEYAIQIADALNKAHRAGITHRDLKPGNVMLTKSGAKLLDFGLAKGTTGVGAAAGLSMLPTTPPNLTVQGTILGTFQYMAPEQLEGHEADARTDIFAFGAVMYEMLTGKKAFAGKSQATLIAAIMSSQPASIAVDQPLVPPALDRVVRKCLAKDPEARWQTARDLHDELQWIGNPGSHEGVPSQRFVDLRRRWSWAIVAAAIAVVVFMSRSLWYSTRPIEQPLIRLDVDLGPDVALAALGSGSTAVISPDGTRLVYAASVSGGRARLFTRRLDQVQAAELPGTDGATWPFFSPDGQWVGFTARNELNKIPVEGGLVVPLGGVTAFTGASWGRDGTIIMGARSLMRIPDGGGTPTTVTELASGELAHGRPQVLPGGKAVLFTVRRSTADAGTASIEVVSLSDQRRKTVLRGGAAGRVLPSGHLVFGDRGTLFAIPFDLERLETHGRAVPVLDGVAYVPQSGVTDFDVSDGGTLVYRKAGRDAATPLSTLDWIDGTGRKTSLRDKPGDYEWPSFSPDGQRLALSVTVEQGTRDVWILDWQRDTMTRLTSGANSGAPTWSPNGQYVIFSGGNAGGMFWTRADGSGQPQPLTQSRDFQVSPSFAPDGKRLAFVEPKGPTSQIWTVPVDDRGGQLRVGTPELFLTVPLVAPVAIVSASPDGRWLAYPSTETGSAEVYVRPFPAPPSGPGSKRQVSNAGGAFPIWSRTSHELFYQSGDQIMTVSYTVNGDAFMAEKPRVWAAKVGGLASDGRRRFDVAPDGKRLAVLTPVEPVQAPKVDHDVVFVLNFLDELRRRAPVGK
jgi:serine/threonine protein kinase/Tol biopolymer transport system component